MAKSKKKVVILFEIPPVITYAKRYDYQTLIDNGFQLEICDLSLFLSDSYKDYNSIVEDSDFINNYRFHDKNEFVKHIKKLSPSTFIWITFQLTVEYYWVFKTIEKYKYGFICNVDYVVPRGKDRFKERGFFSDLSWHRLSNAILLRVPKFMLPVRKADAVITYGEGDVQRKLNNVLYDTHTVIELTNTIDYNECKRALFHNIMEMEEKLPEEYIVFIDEYMPFHPDAISLGLKIEATKYYEEVEKYLDRVSRLLSLPVVIAAHPKADYSKHPEYYKGKTILQFKTAELVKNANLVITHISIAISMALICKKPFLLISTDDIEKMIYVNGQTRDFEEDLGCKAVNVSLQLSDEEVIKQINEALSMGDNYFDGQLKKYRLPLGHPNEDLSFGEIMIKAMNKVIRQNESKKI